MIQGNNELRLNKATMAGIIQKWLDGCSGIGKVEITDVVANTGDNYFIVKIKEGGK